MEAADPRVGATRPFDTSHRHRHEDEDSPSMALHISLHFRDNEWLA